MGTWENSWEAFLVLVLLGLATRREIGGGGDALGEFLGGLPGPRLIRVSAFDSATSTESWAGVGDWGEALEA